jgi:ABC-type proline/glycine betaine transport system ATPase subunit
LEKNALTKFVCLFKTKRDYLYLATHDSTDALSYADQTIVLQNGTLTDRETLLILYNNPNKYVALLFGEVNELKLSQLKAVCKEEEDGCFFCIHTAKSCRKCLMNVAAKQSYFKGGY